MFKHISQQQLPVICPSRSRYKLVLIASSFGLMVAVSGCSSADSQMKLENQQLHNRVSELEAENQRLKTEISSASITKLSKADPNAVNSIPAANPSGPSADSNHFSSVDSVSASTGTAPSSSGPASKAQASTVGFSDVSGLEAEPDIKNLATLGVFEGSSGQFEPATSITRAQYVRWLVKTNNVYFADQPNNRIRLGQPGDGPTFLDVSPSNPDFTFIQGLANAGYVVGVSPTKFAPEKNLTREQLVAIKAQVDEGAAISKYPNVRSFIHFGDVTEIDDAYTDAVHEDLSARTTNNIARIWGNTKVFGPRRNVTRAEAAVSLSKIGSLSNRSATAPEVLKKTNG